MAVDKLVDSTQLNTDLTAVANAIRTKGGTSAQLAFPDGFVSAVEAIETGGGGGGDTLTKIMLSLGMRAFKQLTLPEKIIFPSVTNVETEALNLSIGCKILVLPAVTTIGSYITADSSSFEVIDFGPNTPSFGAWLFSGDSNLSTLIIRKSSVVTLANINVFNNTPFASGKAGGTLYVPQSLISSYQSASNWSTILGYANNSIAAIEGSQYENYYADGTPVS